MTKRFFLQKQRRVPQARRLAVEYLERRMVLSLAGLAFHEHAAGPALSARGQVPRSALTADQREPRFASEPRPTRLEAWDAGYGRVERREGLRRDPISSRTSSATPAATRLPGFPSWTTPNVGSTTAVQVVNLPASVSTPGTVVVLLPLLTPPSRNTLLETGASSATRPLAQQPSAMPYLDDEEGLLAPPAALTSPGLGRTSPFVLGNSEQVESLLNRDNSSLSTDSFETWFMSSATAATPARLIIKDYFMEVLRTATLRHRVFADWEVDWFGDAVRGDMRSELELSEGGFVDIDRPSESEQQSAVDFSLEVLWSQGWQRSPAREMDETLRLVLEELESLAAAEVSPKGDAPPEVALEVEEGGLIEVVGVVRSSPTGQGGHGAAAGVSVPEGAAVFSAEIEMDAGLALFRVMEVATSPMPSESDAELSAEVVPDPEESDSVPAVDESAGLGEAHPAPTAVAAMTALLAVMSSPQLRSKSNKQRSRQQEV